MTKKTNNSTDDLHCSPIVGPDAGHRFKLDGVRDVEARVADFTSKMEATDDDRVRVLVGYLLVENCLHRFLSTWMPEYRHIEDNIDFSFSMRINIARALSLVWPAVLDGADCIRRIRNEFAHHLETKTLDDTPRLAASMRDRLRNLNVEPAQQNSKAFEQLVRQVSWVLITGTAHYHYVNDYVRSRRFEPEYMAYFDSLAR